MSGFNIRLIDQSNPAELERLHEICLLTGASGADASTLYESKTLIGSVYMAQYVVHAAEYAFVLVNQANEIFGYAVGTPDTIQFEQTLATKWWPLKQVEFPLESYPSDSVTSSYKDPELVAVIHNPSFTASEVTSHYPAHFHINLLPPAQGSGNGRRLLTTLLEALAASGVTGVHLGVAGDNTSGIAFYRKLGFETVANQNWGFVMAKTIS